MPSSTPRAAVLRIANAGHLAPLLVEPSGYRWINHEHGLPLGISASKFSEAEVTLGKDSRIAFYSDGITEAEIDSGEEYGAERFWPRCNHPTLARWSARGCQKIHEWNGMRDDATVILVKARGTELGSSGNA